MIEMCDITLEQIFYEAPDTCRYIPTMGNCCGSGEGNSGEDQMDPVSKIVNLHVGQFGYLPNI